MVERDSGPGGIYSRLADVGHGSVRLPRRLQLACRSPKKPDSSGSRTLSQSSTCSGRPSMCPGHRIVGIDPGQVPRRLIVDSPPTWLDEDPPQGLLRALVADREREEGRAHMPLIVCGCELPQRAVLRTPTVADGRSIRRREDGPMPHVRRFDHVGITVADLDAVTAFFVALGLEVEGRTFVEGEFLDTVCGIPNSRTEIVMLKSPDDGFRLELSRFVRPDSVPGSPAAMANELGLRNVAFEVNDLQAAVDWAATEGYGLVGGIGEYEGVWRMAYVRGPEGIIVSLAERLG
jgi:catechol 2,3-dioxygenase-like lactoylglutathione lyase family enzyme